jgi:hypothetical protein
MARCTRFLCSLVGRAGMAAGACRTTHQDRRTDLEEVEADRPDSEQRDGAGNKSMQDKFKGNCTV